MRRMILLAGKAIVGRALIASLLTIAVAGCHDDSSGLTQGQVDSMLGIQSSVQDERQALSRQRDQLEDDRRVWDQRQRREPLIANAISGAALLAACSLPLILVASLLWPRAPQASDAQVCDALVDDLSSDKPVLLAPPKN